MVVLSYAGCSTCKKALKWLSARKLAAEIRPIVESPPTVPELKLWVTWSGKPLRKWLNTSGLSYRALGKATIDAATDEQLRQMLAADGKLVKRPVLVHGTAVLVGFSEDEWALKF